MATGFTFSGFGGTPAATGGTSLQSSGVSFGAPAATGGTSLGSSSGPGFSFSALGTAPATTTSTAFGTGTTSSLAASSSSILTSSSSGAFSVPSLSSTPAAAAGATPATGFSFTASGSTPSLLTSATNSNFSFTPSPAATSAASPATTSATSTLGGFTTPASSPSTSSSATTSSFAPSTTSAGFSFQPSTAASPATSSAISPGLSIPNLSKDSASSPATPSTTPAAAGNFAFPSAAVTASASAASSTTAPASSILSTKQDFSESDATESLRLKTLEEITQEFGETLNTHTSLFMSQASQIAEMDDKLLEESYYIFKLKEDIDRITVREERLKVELASIKSLQNRLNQQITNLEKSQLIQDLDSLPPADKERLEGYNFVSELDSQMNQMDEWLHQIIHKINEKSQVTSDPSIALVVTLLNSQLNQLQWVDSKRKVLTSQLTQASQKVAHQHNFHHSSHY